MNRIQSFFLLCVRAKGSSFSAIYDFGSSRQTLGLDPSGRYQDEHSTENVSSSFPSSSC
jgi:hypothetical protein